MKKVFSFIFNVMGAFFAIMTMALLTGCTDDTVEAGPLESDEWLHPYGASSEDRALQEKFYNDNGIYLLFNDTLKKEHVADNPDGTPYYRYEAVELQYVLTGNNDDVTGQYFSFNYVYDDTRKQSGAQFVQNILLPHLGRALRPFSVLLVDKINYYVSNQSTGYELQLTNPSIFAGSRCTAIDISTVDEMTPDEKAAYCNELLKAIVNSKAASLPESTFDAFYSFCKDYYGTYAMNDDAKTFFEIYPTPYDLGLLDGGYYAWGEPYGFPMYNIKAKSYDLADYVDAVFKYDTTAFEKKYGKYPVVVKKYNILKSIFENLGVEF